jgi:hemolysin activation/secretion protein
MFRQSSYRDDEALGGASSIRGIPRNRYVGKGVAYSNTELRWSAAQFSALGRSTRLVLTGFADVGRVWSNGLDLSTIASDLHVGYGGGVHLAIGPTFVVTGDVGHSSQSTAAIYLGLGYLF